MADGKQILEIVMAGQGGKDPSKPPGDDGGQDSGGFQKMLGDKLGIGNKKADKVEKATTGILKGIGGMVGDTLGIRFNTANIMKQSQVFTSFVGTIFQLMGALVDVILAPFLPILIPVLTLIGSWIEPLGTASQNVANWIFDFFKKVGGWWVSVLAFFASIPTLLTPVVEFLTEKYQIIKPLVDEIISLSKSVWDVIVEWKDAAQPVIDTISNVISSVWNTLTEWKDDLSWTNMSIFIIREIEQFGVKIKTFIDDAWAIARRWGDEVWATLDGWIGKIPEGMYDNLVKWITDLAVPLGKHADSIVKGILAVLPGGTILKVLYAMTKGLTKFFVSLGWRLLKLMLKAGKWVLMEGVPMIVGGLKGLLGRLATGILNIIKSIGSKLPFGLGKQFAKMGTSLKAFGTVTKRIPVIGTAAQLGFGAYESYKAYKKYGIQAGLEFGAKNIAAAGVGLLDLVAPGAGTVLGAGVDIGGTLALERRWKQKALEGEAMGGSANVVVQLNGIDGRTITEKHFDNIKDQEVAIEDMNLMLEQEAL